LTANDESVMRRLNSSDVEFSEVLRALLDRDESEHQQTEDSVREIITSVRKQGDRALIELTNRFDRRAIVNAEELVITSEQMGAYIGLIEDDQRAAIQVAADRIREFHEHQRESSWSYKDSYGSNLGQIVTPINKVGVYVPGGKAAYPSSVLMNIIPAKVAGCGDITMVVPAPDGVVNSMVIAAAAVAGADRIFTIGGAQAVAALAYGTQSISAVDKIVGPGNIFVATAKRQVFGKVGIDMVAGPSEVLIIADETANPEWIAMDLFAQAEHDEMAQSILISPSKTLIDAVEKEILETLPSMQRRSIIAGSLRGNGALIKVRDMQEAADISNLVAPEHLELQVADTETLLPLIHHAGAIFSGYFSAESLGDYCLGPNHVLPTAGTARFSSPLGVYDFQKRSSIINCSRLGAKTLAKTASCLARSEQLEAHARSAELRQ
jgi:histidinol dehydrogenase